MSEECEHMWELDAISFVMPDMRVTPDREANRGGSFSTYRCVLCEALLPVGPDDEPPL